MLRGLHDNLRGGVTVVAHEERGLPGRDQALGGVGPEGGAGRVESEGAESVAPEEAVVTRHCSIARSS